VFEADGSILTSDSTLRFRRRDEITVSLMSAGFVLEDVRDAPDRPGRELVFVARRSGLSSSADRKLRLRSRTGVAWRNLVRLPLAMPSCRRVPASTVGPSCHARPMNLPMSVGAQ
jgi:hypothetical protein